MIYEDALFGMNVEQHWEIGEHPKDVSNVRNSGAQLAKYERRSETVVDLL